MMVVPRRSACHTRPGPGPNLNATGPGSALFRVRAVQIDCEIKRSRWPDRFKTECAETQPEPYGCSGSEGAVAFRGAGVATSHCRLVSADALAALVSESVVLTSQPERCHPFWY
eukprot:752435-Rhodomonas_salina.1